MFHSLKAFSNLVLFPFINSIRKAHINEICYKHTTKKTILKIIRSQNLQFMWVLAGIEWAWLRRRDFWMRISFIRDQFKRKFFEGYDIFSFYEANLSTVWILILVLLHTNCVILDNLLNFSACCFFICKVGMAVTLKSLVFVKTEWNNLAHVEC